MINKKIMTGLLSSAMLITAVPNSVSSVVYAYDTVNAPKSITIDKTTTNPISGFDENGNIVYSGDPSVLVDGDTVYLYCGHDTAKNEAYEIPEWVCYSSKDLVNWTYHGVTMKADKNAITWANTGKDAWAGQVTKHKDPKINKDMYYFYYCTWDSTDSGKQSIGVATSDSPTGPFTDIGHPLVKGSITTNQTSNWNDIDPTVWVEDVNGVEHRYLAWGNGKYYVCELNEDMTSVKDQNSDGKITSGSSVATSDIIEQTPVSSGYTEAPWLFRRTNSETGKVYGPYYLFYAYQWREEMAYSTSTSEDLLSTNWKFGTDNSNGLLMEPTATSNTNHMAVFEFKGKTYFIYHNGSLPGGSGFRRCACITEVNFNSDGSIKPIPETAVGISGKTNKIYTKNATVLAHKKFNNSLGDGVYPYTNIPISPSLSSNSSDSDWAITVGKADKNNKSYISIQSENKPGLYLTANDDLTVTLAQDYDQSNIAETAKKQTFKTVEGLSDNNGVSFESVSYPGKYLTIVNGLLKLTDGTNSDNSTFYLTKPDISNNAKTTNNLTSLAIDNMALDINKSTIDYTVPYTTKSVNLDFKLEDKNGFISINDTLLKAGDKTNIEISSDETVVNIDVYAENRALVKSYKVNIKLDYSLFSIKNHVLYSYDFDNSTNGAVTVVKGKPPVETTSITPTYSDGISNKAINLDGTFGLKLCEGAKLGNQYTISFWMKPNKIGSGVDPTLTAGLFNPEYWLNLSFDGKIWSHDSGYIDTPSSNAYKANEWQHVAISVNDNQATLFVNGKNVSSGKIAPEIMTQKDSMIYFGLNAWDSYFNGALDDLMIIDYPMVTGEISKLSTKAITVNTAGKPLYTPFVENSEPEKPDNKPVEKLTVSAPKLSSVTNSSKAVTVKWTKVSNATGYYVYRNNKKIATIKKATTTSYKDITVKNGSSYIYKVYAYKTKDKKTVNKASSSKKIIYIAATKLKISNTSKKKEIKLRWSNNPKANSYTIEYSTKSSFSKNYTKKLVVKKVTSITIKKFVSNKKYYIRIKANYTSKSKVYSSCYSNTVSAKAK